THWFSSLGRQWAVRCALRSVPTTPPIPPRCARSRARPGAFRAPWAGSPFSTDRRALASEPPGSLGGSLALRCTGGGNSPFWTLCLVSSHRQGGPAASAGFAVLFCLDIGHPGTGGADDALPSTA